MWVGPSLGVDMPRTALFVGYRVPVSRETKRD